MVAFIVEVSGLSAEAGGMVGICVCLVGFVRTLCAGQVNRFAGRSLPCLYLQTDQILGIILTIYTPLCLLSTDPTSTMDLT